MDVIAQLNETDIGKMVGPTTEALLPLLEKNRSKITSVPKRTFKFGATERHQLDVYYPTSAGKRDKSPILFFVYGGGFVTGDRALPQSDLIYACVATLFAQRGFIAVIADYRLVPNVIFPGPVEDIRDAIKWVLKHPEVLINPGSPPPDLDNLFIMGHSAGALCAATLFLLPEILADQDIQAKVSGVVLLSGLYHFKALSPKDDSEFLNIVVTLWGSLEEVNAKSPCGLLESASPATVQALPNMLFVEGKWEPSWLLKGCEDFKHLLQQRTNRSVQEIAGSGHNHVSLVFALGTGQGEEWAEEAIEWMWAASK